ncbi:MAG: hypothetical protein IPK33_16375 [Gemmatimonadetes bacterium]|nr:hypothetical protein [Gemmatimonadota bacterium]
MASLAKTAQKAKKAVLKKEKAVEKAVSKSVAKAGKGPSRWRPRCPTR